MLTPLPLVNSSVSFSLLRFVLSRFKFCQSIRHEQLIEKHQQLLERFYETILNEDEDTDVSDEISQLSSLIKSYQELVAVQSNDL